MSSTNNKWAALAISNGLERVHEYFEETRTGRVDKGIRILFPEIARHFYIFHRVVPKLDISSTMSDGRFLFYQIPFSEKRPGRAWIRNISNIVKKWGNARTESEWTYSLGSGYLKLDKLNRSLASPAFDIKFASTRMVHELLRCGLPGTHEFDEFQNHYQRDKMMPFLASSEPPNGYKKSLFALEKVLFEDVSSPRILVRQYPLHHLGIWFGILSIVVDGDKCCSSVVDFDSRVAVALPWIAQKIYRFVFENRFATKLFDRGDAWTVDQLSRIAATGGMNNVQVSSASRTCRFFREGEGTQAPEYDRYVQFEDGLWRIRFSTSKRNDACLQHALSEMTAIAQSVHERVHQARRSATAAIMSRNMSHNLGSHALANSKFFWSVGLLDEKSDRHISKDEIQNARARLQAFNQYCQGRLDFIARKLSEDGDKPEPMFFVNDVLKGFMTQQVLLDTLLDDNGFNTRNIRFVIHGNGKTDVWAYRDPEDGSRHWEFVGPEKTEVKDVLVGVTGGVTGCHALYAILENLLRNAAKYSKPGKGQSKIADLELHIEFLRSKVKGEECYRLRLWENLTDDKRGEVVATVREGLSRDVIDEEGKPTKGGHGMQEMRLCAEYLAGNDSGGKPIRFPSDIPEKDDTSPDEHEEIYHAFVNSGRKKSKDKGKDLTKPALRAYTATSVTEKRKRHPLVYELLLPNPLLLGLVCVRQGGDGMEFGTACKPQYPCVRCFPTLEVMGKTSPHFGLIIANDAKPATVKGTLEKVARLNAALPFRLLVVTPSKEDRDEWQRAVENASANPERFYPPSEERIKTAINAFDPNHKSGTPILPNRRLHVICNASFFPVDAAGKSQSTPEDMSKRLQAIEENEWGELILKVYEQWIEAWKGRPERGGKWHLLIGFERDARQVEERWREPLQSCVWAKSLLDVTIGSLPDGEDTETAAQSSKAPNKGTNKDICVFAREGSGTMALKDDVVRGLNLKACLVFNNHGEVFPDLRNPTISSGQLRFYHKFSGGEMTLYQLLETPPTEDFAFGFYLLSLLEACLTNVVTLDERIADAALVGGKPAVENNSPLGLLRSSGIRPLFSFDRAPSDPKVDTPTAWMSLVNRRFITPNLKEWMAKKLRSKHGKNDAREQIRWEGIRFDSETAVLPLQEFSVDTTQNIADGGVDVPRHQLVDAIVIHEGITDTFFKDGLWHEGDHLRLYSLLPIVVRTSGRGRESRHLGQTLPFIELNVLSDSCYGSLNKIKLAKALLGVSGELPKPEKQDE